MIPRYQTPVLRELWSDEHKYQCWLHIEIAYLEAYMPGEGTLIARLKEAQNKINWTAFAERVLTYEQRLKHDVIAFLEALEDELQEDARLLHSGLTSSDIVDTAFAMLLTKASDHLLVNLQKLIKALWQKALENRGVLCLGRTHGQAADVTSFGIKLLGHCCELVRAFTRIKSAQEQIAVGKFSGAVGTYAHSSPELEERALSALGLKAETVATQIVARDRHAHFFCVLATLAGSLERLALEIRLLSHGQIKEVSEAFSRGQKGSSAMPHKKNPVQSENICGLMRLIRSSALAALENQALWHERDISHSSVERMIAPDATGLIDFALVRLRQIINDLQIDRSYMSEHVRKAGDALCSQKLMLALIQKGLMRKNAYELVQKAVLDSAEQDLKTALHKLGINAWLSDEELSRIFAPPEKLAFEDEIFKRAFDLAQNCLGET